MKAHIKGLFIGALVALLSIFAVSKYYLVPAHTSESTKGSLSGLTAPAHSIYAASSTRASENGHVIVNPTRRALMREKFNDLKPFSSEKNPQMLLSVHGFIEGMAMNHPELDLSLTERKALEVLCADFFQVIGQLKAEDAKVTRSSADVVEVTVSANLEDAKDLAALFVEELNKRLPSKERATEIDGALAKDLFLNFAGYRAADEKYTFTRSASNPNMYAFHFDAALPEQFRNSPQNVFDNKFLGTGTDYSEISLQAIVNFPEFGFLQTVLKSDAQSGRL